MADRTTRPHIPLAACRIRRYVVALAVLARLAGAPVLAQTGAAQVDRGIDGDTISVRRDGARFTVVNVHSSTPRCAARRGRWADPEKESMMTKEIADAGTLSTKAGKALDRMRARADQADQCRRGAELADRTRHRWAR